MKKILLVLLAAIALILPLISFCQTEKKVITDSIWVTNTAGVFYQSRLLKYSNGEQSTTVTIIGDTATTQTKYLSETKSTTSTMANDANIVRGYRLQLSGIIKFGSTSRTTIGVNILDSIRNERYDEYFTESWSIGKITEPEDYIGISWIEQADTLNYITDTTIVNRKAEIIGNVIRLYNLNGYDTDFYLTQDGYYQTVDGLYIILPQGESPPDYVAGRSLKKPKPAIVPKTELLPNGTVRIGELIFKYNSKQKVWKELK